MRNKKASRQIDAMGGTSAAAALCEVTNSAVSQWRINGIPKPRLQFLQLARPDIFPKPAIKRTKRTARTR